jgi:molecular chaperone DnaK
MNQAMEALTQAQHKLAEALYRQQAPGGAAGAAPGGAAPSNSGDAAGPAQGDVIDAEVVDENK